MRQKSRHNWNFKVQLQDRGAQSSDLTKWLRRGKVASADEVTYLYISGKVTVPKQSEFNVNSYNKDTVNFVNANVLI